MIISYKHKFIFMKTRKTAGSSIQKALVEFCGPDDIITPDVESLDTARNIDKFFTDHPHPPIRDVRQFVGDDVWNSFFKFAFVRNPWSLVVSRYHWNKRGKECSVDDFKVFLKKYCSDEAHWGPAHFYVNDLQQNYTCINGNLELNYVGKIETLVDDFKVICDTLNIPNVNLSRSKSSYKPKNFNHYSEYYDEELMQLVYRYFFDDIEKFGYIYNQEIVTRRINPIIIPKMLSEKINDNINGPSLIKVPDWVENPLGKYYLYFAHHQGKYIRMAYSDNVEGPYTIYEKGTLQLSVTTCKTHIASPDVHIDEDSKRIVMYYHGDIDDGQKSFISWSRDGLDFETTDKVLGEFYFRVFRYNDKFYSVAKNKNIDGIIYESDDWDGEFKPLFNLLPNIRHTAVYIKDNMLFLFYSIIGDRPESILMIKINLDTWDVISIENILKPQTEYEGGNLPLMKSMPGSSTLRYGGPVNELRDPYVYSEDEKLYMLYSLAGECGIGLSQIYNVGKS
tara:strand:+ start:799 stop:2319 length:1521 start_codon:yes stop_codon:yes gene_type:complete